jgi:hypothetical protein
MALLSVVRVHRQIPQAERGLLPEVQGQEDYYTGTTLSPDSGLLI